MVRFQETYKNEVSVKLKERFQYTNPLQIPRLEKIVLNMGVGDAIQNPKLIESAVADLAAITGQKPVIRKAKKSIANFKLREGLPIGVSVTLRKERMFEFLDRLVTIALPRVRDFRGVPRNSFDGKGNYSLGISEQIIFPEIDLEKTQLRGLSITFVTSAKTDEEGRALLEEFGFPFRKKQGTTVQ
ncbi:MAG TPA: 50S ribosomal protein L5 [Oligoflexia bacterium]|nr:50S ribosomal protein L5 [Oligoflexia bacterium]HMP49193.1 50S ribosomal protein L5 [Oligoflexia bacterium]